MFPFRLFSLIALVSLCSLASASSAQATEFAALVVHNPTDVTIKYQIKWGNNEWKSYSVAPGAKRFHSYVIDQYGNAPLAYIRFDFIGGDGEVTFRTYRLETYAVQNPWDGRHHTFRYSSDGKFLNIFK